MSVSPKTLVERFYFEMWNRVDAAAAREILHPEFRAGRLYRLHALHSCRFG